MSEETNKIRILAVDDSKVMRKAMSKVLGQDYDVIEAEHGEDAWTILLHEREIQIVFTDLSMPYLDGFGLLKRIRESEDEHFQNMPVIIITGKEDDDETKQQALDAGASDFITKPFDSVQLRARAQTHINLETTSKKLAQTEDKLEKQSAIDELTGLNSQNYFQKMGEETLSHAVRHNGQFILLRLDIDDFNRIFIANGKQFADNILNKVGVLLAQLCRKEDTAARIGLAKFAMLCRDTDLESSSQLAERIRKEINAIEFKYGENIFRITVSIGLLEPKIDQGSVFSDMFSETEKYMQKASKEGGNQIAIKSLRKESFKKQISISTALKLIQQDHTEYLKNHVTSLTQQLLPLLDFLAGNTDSEISDQLAAIKKQLEKNSRH
ncbi:MAG: response regulator [Gammaproteobacteria bacterium]|nr:response regulator [Gammaproteobacteria bacterium]